MASWFLNSRLGDLVVVKLGSSRSITMEIYSEWGEVCWDQCQFCSALALYLGNWTRPRVQERVGMDNVPVNHLGDALHHSRVFLDRVPSFIFPGTRSNFTTRADSCRVGLVGGAPGSHE